MSTSVTLPALGESVTEGTVSRWLKQVGDQVEADEPLVVVLFLLPDQLGPAREVLLVELDERAEAEAGLRRLQADTAAELLLLSAGGSRKAWKESAARPFVRSATSPVGRVALELSPLPMHTAVTRSLLFPTLLTRSISDPRGQRKGQEVGHAKLAESEERTVVVDLLSVGPSPHLFA